MSQDPYYLVRRSHLPEAMQRTIRVMELLDQDPHMSVLEAVRQVGLSRSAFYKYKEAIKPIHSSIGEQIVTLALTLLHERGVLSDVLNRLAASGANILTINQSLPLQGKATVIVSLETRNMESELDDALDHLRTRFGVEQVNIVGQG